MLMINETQAAANAAAFIAGAAVTVAGVAAFAVKERDGGRVSVALFVGKGAKPKHYYSFRTMTAAQNWITETAAGENRAAQFRAEQAAERKAKAAGFVMPFAVGDVLHGSWGYDQTNCEFAEVVAIVGKRTIELRPLRHVGVEGTQSYMSESVTPATGADRFAGAAYRCMVSIHGYARCKDHGHAGLSKWDGRPKYSSHYA